jgi:drug/metabolite transporter (DMT)-like permease
MPAPFALTIALLLGIVAQLSLKHGAMIDPNDTTLGLLTRPPVVSGYSLYFISSLFYVYSLRTLPVGAAFSSASLSYFFVAFFAHLFWKEPFGPSQWLGLLCITGGVFLMFRQSIA